MTWTNVYLVCFLLGFVLSAVSWLLGTLGLHVHVHAHSPVPHAAHAPHAGALARGGPSAFNFSTAMAFLAWFGGAGYLLTRYAGVWPVAALLVAVGIGCAGATIVFWFMSRVLWSEDENLDPDDYEIVGLLGSVISPIREGGTGEILFQQAGVRRVAGARSENGVPIGKGVEVVITRYENGLVYVRTWDELTGETR